MAETVEIDASRHMVLQSAGSETARLRWEAPVTVQFRFSDAEMSNSASPDAENFSTS